MESQKHKHCNIFYFLSTSIFNSVSQRPRKSTEMCHMTVPEVFSRQSEVENIKLIIIIINFLAKRYASFQRSMKSHHSDHCLKSFSTSFSDTAMPEFCSKEFLEMARLPRARYFIK